MKNWIFVVPAILALIGALYGINEVPGKSGAYYFGVGLGLNFVAAIPSALSSWVYYQFFVKNKKKSSETIDDMDLLETDAFKPEKKPWVYYFCLHMAFWGMICILAMVT